MMARRMITWWIGICWVWLATQASSSSSVRRQQGDSGLGTHKKLQALSNLPRALRANSAASASSNRTSSGSSSGTNAPSTDERANASVVDATRNSTSTHNSTSSTKKSQQLVNPWIEPSNGANTIESFGFLTKLPSLTQDAKQNLTGCVAALVSTRHLLADPECAKVHELLELEQNSNSSWLFLKTQRLDVEQIVVIGDTMALITLSEQVDPSLGVQPFKLQENDNLAADTVFPQLEVVAFDKVLTRQSTQRTAVQSIWILNEMICHDSPLRNYDCFAPGKLEDRKHTDQINAGFLVTSTDRFLIGIVQTKQPEQQNASGIFRYSRVSPAWQEELNEATNNSLIWLESVDIGKKEPQVAPTGYHHQYITQLVYATPKPWQDSCQAVLIAPSFVLTSSDCESSGNVVKSVVIGASPAIQEEIPVKRSIPRAPAMLLELQFPSSRSPISMLSSFAKDSRKALPFLAHSKQAKVGEVIEVVSEPMHFMINESACGLSDQNDNTSSVRCVMNLRVLQGREVTVTPRTGDLLEYQRNGMTLMFGLAIGSNARDPAPATNDSSIVSFYRVDLLQTFLKTYCWGHLWMELTTYTGEQKNKDFGGRGKMRTQPPPMPSTGSPAPGVGLSTSDPSISFLVGLHETQDGQKFCEGTLISLMHVLTAAHCVRGGHAKWVSVVPYNAKSPEVIRVAEDKTVFHPSFGSPLKNSYDVAILELEYSSAIGKPIVLDNSADFSDDTSGIAYVFDGSAKEISVAKAVVGISLPIWSRQRCSSKMPSIDDSMMCAGGRAGQDTCQGDSGGPLVVTDGQNQKFLAGVVSGGYKCGVEGIPGIYARVADVAGFIDAYVGVDHRWRFLQSKKLLGGESGGNVARGVSGPSDATTDPPVTSSRRNPSNPPEYKTNDMTAGSSGSGAGPSAGTKPPVSSFTLSTRVSTNVRHAVTDFVFGEHDDAWVKVFPTGMWEALHNQDRSLVFLSSASLSGIEHVIAQFEQRAVASGRATRSNRFGSSSNRANDRWSSVCGRPTE